MHKPIILILLLISVYSPLCLFQPSEASPVASLSVEPPVLTGLEIGDTFTINITITNITDLYAWQIPLYYKSSVLNATAIAEGPFLRRDGANTFFTAANFTDNYNATHGQVFLAATRVGVPNGLDGTGILATVSFKTIAYGNSHLYIDDKGHPPDYPDRAKLIDSTQPFGKEISHEVYSGRVHVGLVDIAILDVAAPLNIPKGDLILINVTVENQGITPQTFDVTLNYEATTIGTKTVADLPPTANQTLTFPWDTAPIPIGEYRLTAHATQIPGEVDLEDNNYYAGLIYVGKRDIAITNTQLSKTYTNDTIVDIKVTVTNNGEAGAIFNLTVYLDTNPIGEKFNMPLGRGATFTYIFNLDTLPLPRGVYTISSTASAVPGESNTADNTYDDGTIIETIRGDVTGDFKVDINDIYQFGRAFGTTEGHLRWNPNCDLNNDGQINIQDIYFAARNFGKSDP